MIKIPKTIIAIGIVALVAFAIMNVVPAHEWDEGAPTASINVLIEKTDGTGFEGDVEIQPESVFNNIMTSYPLTSYTADVAPLEPDGYYSISFAVTVNTLGNVAEAYTTTVSITGHNNKTEYPITGFNGPKTYGVGFYATGGTTVTDTKATQYNVPAVFTIPTFDGIVQPNGEILGEFIDESVFLINIISEGASGSYGMTSATVTISVGAGGSLFVEITDITTTVG